jgi:hypothetical protein
MGVCCSDTHRRRSLSQQGSPCSQRCLANAGFASPRSVCVQPAWRGVFITFSGSSTLRASLRPPERRPRQIRASVGDVRSPAVRRPRPSLKASRPAWKPSRPANTRREPSRRRPRPALTPSRPTASRLRPPLKRPRPTNYRARPALSRPRPIVKRVRPPTRQPRLTVKRSRPDLS